jgi:hypothetical protein
MNNKFLYTIKFIACMAVIAIHTRFPDPFGQYIDALARFAVPFFFALSGRYLLTTADESVTLREVPDIRKRVKGKLFKLLRITGVVYGVYLAYSFIYHLLMNNTPYEWFTSKFNLTEFKWFVMFGSGKFIYDGSYTFDHMWYLFALLYVYLLIIIFAPLLRKWMKGLIVILLFFLYLGEALQIYYPIRPFGINISTWYVVRNWLFVGMPFVLIGALFGDIIADIKKDRSRQEYMRIFNLWKAPGLCLLSIGILSTCFESLVFGKVEVYLGSLIIVIALMMLSEGFSDKGRFVWKIGKEASSNIYFYHVLLIAVIDLGAVMNIWPAAPMGVKAVMVMVLSILMFYMLPKLVGSVINVKKG